jgi:hypothetical protein
MSASKTSAGYFSVLPQELCLYILSFLEWRDLSNMSLLNRQWQSLSRDNMLWKALCAKHWKEMWNSSSRSGLSTSSTELSSLSSTLSSASPESPAPEQQEQGEDDEEPREDGDGRTSLEPRKKKPKTEVAPTPDTPTQTQPPAWQDVFKSRLLVDRNWRMGNCAARTLAPQSEVESAAFCLHFDDERFVTATDTIEARSSLSTIAGRVGVADFHLTGVQRQHGRIDPDDARPHRLSDVLGLQQEVDCKRI